MPDNRFFPFEAAAGFLFGYALEKTVSHLWDIFNETKLYYFIKFKISQLTLKAQSKVSPLQFDFLMLAASLSVLALFPETLIYAFYIGAAFTFIEIGLNALNYFHARTSKNHYESTVPSWSILRQLNSESSCLTLLTKAENNVLDVVEAQWLLSPRLIRSQATFTGPTKVHQDNTVLHWAAYHGNLELIELFVKKGCDVNVKNRQGQTPIDFALHNNKMEAVEALKELGAIVPPAIDPAVVIPRPGDDHSVALIYSEHSVRPRSPADRCVPLSQSPSIRP